jgi:isoleucyl-tRNA synthetase
MPRISQKPAKTKKRSAKKVTEEHPDFLGSGEFSLPQAEERVLAFWKEKHIFEKSVSKNAAKSAAKKFIFYEGPPYANGTPAMHHVIGRVVKDVVLRYKTMRGYNVPRRAGWDTHGLPVEMAVEKALGFKSKKDIEAYGVEKFNEKAREQVWIHKDKWERLTERIGYWLDLKNAYVTYSPEYIETIWWTLAEMNGKKLLYKGHKVVPWCTRCGTSLSSHELAQGYKLVQDNSVYVKFKLKEGQKIGNFTTDDKTYILSWTTTPWTLPGNVALAINSKVTYAVLNVPKRTEIEIIENHEPLVNESRGGFYVLAKAKAEEVQKETGGVAEYEFSGSKLVGLEYEPLFNVKPLQKEKSYKVYPADFVTTTDGTGVVHTAVMYGEDDYALGKEVGLPEYHTVDEEGKFTNDVPDLAGLYAKSNGTEEKIFEHLKKNGTFLRTEKYEHEYPHCWRCGTSLLYYARTSWFIAMSKLRKELSKNNDGIHWMPEYIRDGRMGEWLREAKDWNLSRERYWGAPLPIWECKKCDATEVIGGLEALNEAAGGPRNQYWVMRHGEAESNVFDIIDSGQRKYLHLTPRGKKQVRASIKKFKREFAKKKLKLDMIIASDVTRTRETEEIDASVFSGEKVMLDKRLEEIHLGPTLTGYRDGKYSKDFPTYEARFETRPEGGESLRDVRARTWSFLKECEEKYEGKNILIVAHDYPSWMLFHTGKAWSEKQAITEKEKMGGDFLKFAEIRKLDFKVAPRNGGGEVDLHRPFVDDVVLPCKKCRGAMRRVPEVADVWYDSGAMPFAQMHFPFDQKTAKPGKSKAVAIPKGYPFPADYIAEGMDQLRGWFYTLLAISTALGYGSPYKNVITFGLLNDKFGNKMSKSKGNVIEPFAVIDKYGTDAVRWYFYTGTPFGEPKNFDEDEVGKSLRKTHLIVYNSFVFWKTYADQTKSKIGISRSSNALDRWILARLNGLVDSVTKKLDHYEIREAALEMDGFVDDLSRWYIRRSRRRLQRPEDQKDYAAASAVLHEVLLSLVQLMAPFTPFFSEMLYGALGGGKESVHLDEWPKAERRPGDEKLIADMTMAREFAAQGLARRAEAGIKVRQPLASMTIGTKLAKDIEQILADEVNVKKILVDKKIKEGITLDVVITERLRAEGVRRDFARMAQELRQKAGLQPKDKIAIFLAAPEEASVALHAEEKIFLSDVGAKSILYVRSEKFDAEESGKWEGKEVWMGIKKI